MWTLINSCFVWKTMKNLRFFSYLQANKLSATVWWKLTKDKASGLVTKDGLLLLSPTAVARDLSFSCISSPTPVPACDTERAGWCLLMQWVTFQERSLQLRKLQFGIKPSKQTKLCPRGRYYHITQQTNLSLWRETLSPIFLDYTILEKIMQNKSLLVSLLTRHEKRERPMENCLPTFCR